MIKLVRSPNPSLSKKNEEEIIAGADLLISYRYIEIENFLNISEIDINNSLDTSKLAELKKKYNNIVIFSSNVLSKFNRELMEIADKIHIYILVETFEEYNESVKFIKNDLGRIKEFEDKTEYKWGTETTDNRTKY
jgi:hypothetical protein